MQGPGHWSSLLKKMSVEHTLTLGYFYCEFTFRAQFQYVVCKYDLNCVENANHLTSTQGKIHGCSYQMEGVSTLTNQLPFLEKIDIEIC